MFQVTFLINAVDKKESIDRWVSVIPRVDDMVELVTGEEYKVNLVRLDFTSGERVPHVYVHMH